ncbi:hypothetical protein NEMBOFW57_009532 [Staphylotrichum longicolle]|uniref:NAD(P)-binding domain-containing protein n=1 Tax=Staphylotrichum longicolle TaxID=669026 RepID=A0AAD4ET03_9PEZI|nr:hypothetical protein NEMBOFW57_009532 [Staphylotrichum longicolle]
MSRSDSIFAAWATWRVFSPPVGASDNAAAFIAAKAGDGLERNVVHAGKKATGNLGPAILAQLLAHAFEVTVLIRQQLKQHHRRHIFPPSVQVGRVNYASRDSLVSALRGHDAVVSALPSLVVDLLPHGDP